MQQKGEKSRRRGQSNKKKKAKSLIADCGAAHVISIEIEV
jgi:hypothetical protein